MRVNVVSDLHLECGPLELPGGDVLILSGDICEARNVKNGHYQKFFSEQCAKYREVIYVMGNHEHYHGKFGKTYTLLAENMPSNVTILEDQCHEIDGVLFIGATLWTDLNKYDPLTAFHVKSMMNDYKAITHFYEARNLYYKLTPEVTMEVHRRSRDYIKTVLANRRAEGKTGPVVVCTHHAPSEQSVHEQYKYDTTMNGAYYSNLEQLILDNPEIRVWTHGHMHNQFDYMVGDTRVVCNPRGYVPYESTGFDPNFGFDI